MSRILLADDSPHAQRMGSRILGDEGFEVVSVTDGDSAMAQLAAADPDLVLADVFLPGKSGIEICRYVKSTPGLSHVRVVLTAGLLEPFDETEAERAGCDAIVKKPFEASKILETIQPLLEQAQLARRHRASTESPEPATPAAQPGPPAAPSPREYVALRESGAASTLPSPAPSPEIDAERVRAAVTVALDAALPAMIQEITERVLIALGH